MKKLLVTLLLSVSFVSVFAAHIKGGFFTYEYLGPGINNPAYNRYKIRLTIYMVCNPSPGQLTNTINFTIFQGNSSVEFARPSVSITNQYNLSKLADEPCITNNQAICYYTIVEYELNNYELPLSPNGYTISYQRCCRIGGMENVQNSGNAGNTYSIKIPGTLAAVPDADKNSSPQFPVNDTVVVCSGSFFRYPLTATDKDGDLLTYSLCSALDGGSTSMPAPVPSSPPPYNTITYASPYSGSQPLGAGVTINASTGLISGIAPIVSSFSSGEFVITVCVTETRGGLIVGESRKELHIQVKDCVPLVASLAPKAVTCDGFSVNFSNATTLQSGTIYNWNFGDPASGVNNTSSVVAPTHLYTDTGVYKVLLEVSLNGFCQSKDSLLVRVYPGFFPAFSTIGPLCKGQPVSFVDNTTTNYGNPTGWRWNFGNLSATDDTSRLRNPSYTYNTAGTYNVELIVGNTFGCIDTIINTITIADKPVLTMLSKDTNYCGLDTLQLNATGNGNFTWTPSVNIIDANTASPTVYPTVPTLYYATLNLSGCISRDSVRVTPKNDLTTSITASAAGICEEDTLTLTGNSNYSSNLSWSWSPAATVASPLSKVTTAYPTANTTYTLTTRLGKNCVATASQLITVRPLAIPNAGPDAAVCIGQTTAQLNASGGTTYQWLPATGLSNAGIPNPVATPAVSTTYQVLVGVTGCTKVRRDTVEVVVRNLPAITVTNDTLICSIDTLQLNTTGTGGFVWTPNVNINSITIPNPLVSPDAPVTYYTTLTDAFGCKSRDSVFVDVKMFVTINAGNDTTICRTDSIFINTISDALNYVWTPAAGLDSDTAKRPLANPLGASTTYTVTGNIGKCQSQDQVTITTVPYPQITVSPDTLICYGESAPLQSTGGANYTWSPVTFLTNSTTASTMAVSPTTDTRYTVSITDTLGCPKPVTASTWVRVYPIVVADAGPTDTTVVIGQPLNLNGTGGDSYTWTPATWLNNPNIFNPLALPEDNINFKLTVSTTAGCSDTDSINVKVYKVPPSFYVPTGFSPNRDNRNEIIKPILLGMRSLKYFRVYNRWGQLIYATSIQNQGWDGTYKGNLQDPGTYVWMAEGQTYTGEVIKKQGTVILLR